MSMWFAVGYQKICARGHEVAKVWSDKLDILKVSVMLPETIDNQSRLILLNGELWLPLSINP